MKQEYIILLAQIYNSLVNVEIKNKQSIRAGEEALEALKNLILQLQEENRQKGEIKDGE